MALRKLYPEIEAFSKGFLTIGAHKIYYEESGNPKGKAAVFVHGGPGGGTSPKCRRFFDPAAYRIVLFDQRGCGQSTPMASLENNTTWDLVSDMERLREHLGIGKWLVFGGSWGSTLALAYAIKHAEHVSELVLRGIFLLRKREIDWFYQEGASFMFPDAWEDYTKVIPAEERGDFVKAYYKRLCSPDMQVRKEAAKAWSTWEARTSYLLENKDLISRAGDDQWADAFARIECHYFINGGFFDEDGWLLKNIGVLRNKPAVIVQGRYDLVCPMYSAWDLHRAWPEAELHISPSSGHSAWEEENVDALVRACDRFRDS